MKILVCIKQVCNTEYIKKIDSDAARLILHSNTEFRMNRFDEHALEEALKLKEGLDGVSIDVVTVGGINSVEVIKRAFGMGADRGIHILKDDDNEDDPFSTAESIVCLAMKEGYDIIFSGIMSEDLMQAQTGQIIAELLNYPCVTGVVGFELQPEGRTVKTERESEGGAVDIMLTKLPAMFTVQAGINIPRYPLLSNMLKADSKEILRLKAASLNPRQKRESINYPEKKRRALFLEGSVSEKAEMLYKILLKKSVIKKKGVKAET